MSLQRFHAAQDDPDSGYSNALNEIKSGRKTSHWIWYIFPQIEGLGYSGMARDYSLRDLEEACSYLLDSVLRDRYLEITRAVGEQLEKGLRLESVMGSKIDALKVVSSLTLFQATESVHGQNPDLKPLYQSLRHALTLSSSQGFHPCSFTLNRLSF